MKLPEEAVIAIAKRLRHVFDINIVIAHAGQDNLAAIPAGIGGAVKWNQSASLKISSKSKSAATAVEMEECALS